MEIYVPQARHTQRETDTHKSKVVHGTCIFKQSSRLPQTNSRLSLKLMPCLHPHTRSHLTSNERNFNGLAYVLINIKSQSA